MKTQKVIDFSDIFTYADTMYGISWNECNNVFFGNSLEYGQHCTVYPKDWAAYVGFSDVMQRPLASNYTRLEVESMSNLDKSYVILSAYFESIGVTDDEVLVDCT
jgi:hypothetical protein